MSAIAEANASELTRSHTANGSDQACADAHRVRVAPDNLDEGHTTPGAQARCALVNTLDPGQTGNGAQTRSAGVNPLVGSHGPCEPHGSTAADTPETIEQPSSIRRTSPGSASEFALGIAAETLTDLERTRIALENRLRAMQQFHGTESTPQYAALTAIKDGLAQMEHGSELVLKRTLRKHPLGAWVKRTVGIGEKQGARLIAAIGDPAWNDLDQRPRRGAAELWAYCGYVPGQKRRKGVRSNWNAEAKMRAHLVAESCMKQMASPYRAKYDAARANWADRDTTDGHKHNHAVRVVAKAVLKDMFLAAKENAA